MNAPILFYFAFNANTYNVFLSAVLPLLKINYLITSFIERGNDS